MERPAPAVLLDVNLQALKVIRSLGRRGVPVIGVVPEKGRWELTTRYCEVRECPGAYQDDNRLLEFLARLAIELKSRPILIPMQDDGVLFVARHQEHLQQQYRFLMTDSSIVEALVSKSGLEDLATRCGIAQPATYSLQAIDDVRALAGEIRYPALIKPEFSRSWQTGEARRLVSGKVVVVDNDEQLRDRYEYLAPLDNRMVVQELIPGPDHNLVYYIGYFDENSDPLASFVGVKERITPVHFGSASYVVSRNNREVVDLCVQFMKEVRYKGHVGIELKLDERDNTYKLIEINARFGLWDGLPALCGIDFARINYDYLLGKPVSVESSYADGVKWISLERDVRAFIEYRRESSLKFGEWISSITTGRRDFAVFALDDPLPFILSTYHLMLWFLRGVLRKVFRRS